MESLYGFRPDVGGLAGLIVTALLPILVKYVTNSNTSGATKAFILLGFASVKTVIESVLQANETGVDLAIIPIVFTTIVNFAIAVSIHFGLYKPTGVTGASPAPVPATEAPTQG